MKQISKLFRVSPYGNFFLTEGRSLPPNILLGIEYTFLVPLIMLLDRICMRLKRIGKRIYCKAGLASISDKAAIINKKASFAMMNKITIVQIVW